LTCAPLRVQSSLARVNCPPALARQCRAMIAGKAMDGWRFGVVPMRVGRAILAIALACGGHAEALIAGRDAESQAAGLEKQEKFKEAAVWRLAAARAFRELIIPFEVENVRAFSQVGKKDLAEICSQRAEVLYPDKVRKNLALYEQDLQKAGGEALRKDVEQEVTELLAKFAPIPTSIPCRLSRIEELEKEGKWAEAADYREVAARVYLLITVPFFERESDRAKGEKGYRRWQVEALENLKLARESFVAAAENYKRAADPTGGKGGAPPAERSAFHLRKAAEMHDQADALSFLIAAKERQQKPWTGDGSRQR